MLDGLKDHHFPKYFPSVIVKRNAVPVVQHGRRQWSENNSNNSEQDFIRFEHEPNYSESDEQGVEIARYDIFFQINDATFLVANDDDDANFYGGSVTSESFSQN